MLDVEKVDPKIAGIGAALIRWLVGVDSPVAFSDRMRGISRVFNAVSDADCEHFKDCLSVMADLSTMVNFSGDQLPEDLAGLCHRLELVAHEPAEPGADLLYPAAQMIEKMIEEGTVHTSDLTVLLGLINLARGGAQ